MDIFVKEKVREKSARRFLIVFSWGFSCDISVCLVGIE